MKISKITSLKSDFKFKAKKREKGDSTDELVHPRIQAKKANAFGSKKASNSLLLQMYSQENEVLFI
ncbi:hypothetical protein [Flavobacterium sp. ACAM 123]|jgi:hypothetical protein|uniref:hypothetical protein n=1 Tax=Flavobacterium sp. ACAM 123 TaxID=1189620 RepID=UPI0002ECEA9D|nr:hypothetical protein [Flavobacterium sp. ACAM 123]